MVQTHGKVLLLWNIHSTVSGNSSKTRGLLSCAPAILMYSLQSHSRHYHPAGKQGEHGVLGFWV